MKNLMFALLITLFTSVASFAQNGSSAEQRANNLSDKMIRELQLNNYQSRKLRAINLDKTKKMMDLETKYANNPAELAKCINGVCKERDLELEALLSTVQYSQYYSARKSFNSYDREYAMNLERQNGKVAQSLVGKGSGESTHNFPKPVVTVVKAKTTID